MELVLVRAELRDALAQIGDGSAQSWRPSCSTVPTGWVAGELGINVGTLRTRVHYARCAGCVKLWPTRHDS